MRAYSYDKSRNRKATHQLASQAVMRTEVYFAWNGRSGERGKINGSVFMVLVVPMMSVGRYIMLMRKVVATRAINVYIFFDQEFSICFFAFVVCLSTYLSVS